MKSKLLSRASIIGRLLRLPLDLLPEDLVVRILRGKMRGVRWVKGAGEHGYWLGTYEQRKRKAMEGLLRAGQIFFDIGANVGYFSLLAAKLTAPDGFVVAFEPLPRNTNFLRQHIGLNALEQRIKLYEAAVSDHDGKTFFDLGKSSAMGHIASQGQLEVQLLSLDSLIKSGEVPMPDVMKIDVEGAEFEVLQGAKEILAEHHPLLFIDTHARTAHDKSIQCLLELGYELELLDGKPLAESKEIIASWHKN